MEEGYVLIVEFQNALYQCPAAPIFKKRKIPISKVVDILYDNKVVLKIFSQMWGYLSFYKRLSVG